MRTNIHMHHVCPYACTHTYKHICVQTYICIHVRQYACTHTYKHICVQTYVYIHVCPYACTHTYKHILVQTYIYIRVCPYACTHYLCVYVRDHWARVPLVIIHTMSHHHITSSYILCHIIIHTMSHHHIQGAISHGAHMH